MNIRHLFFTFFFAFLIFAPSIQAQKTTKEWILVSKVYEPDRKIKQGQKIKVIWNGISGLKTSEGKLVDIMADSLALTFKGHTGSIAKKDIKEIAIKDPRLGKQLLSALLILAGVIITGFFLLIQAITSLSETNYPGEKRIYWPWALVGIGILALGIAKSKPTKIQISEPFGKEWTIQETPAKTNKLP